MKRPWEKLLGNECPSASYYAGAIAAYWMMTYGMPRDIFKKEIVESDWHRIVGMYKEYKNNLLKKKEKT